MLQLRMSMPPAPRTRMQNQPTLLFSWWCTSFAATIILLRLCGRKIRSNQLFREDWILMAALIPLFVRMVFIHFVLIDGTNNVATVGEHFSPIELQHREMGSRLVLPGRIFYAMFIWFCKLTVSEFLKRITLRMWRPSYELVLRGIRLFLLVTFVAVVIATLAECQPFDHYWQVIPDPGARCRLGYGHLFTMGVCDVITDLLLILFPIPIVLMSGQNWRGKLQLVSLFSLSIVMIAITVTRMTMVVRHGGLQQYRTVWASCEILASAATTNAVVLGSFVRDKGSKRNKYVSYSVSDSIDRVSTRRPTLCTFGSDDDLFRSVGCRLPEDLKDTSPMEARPAPPALPGSPPPHVPRMPSMASIRSNEIKLKEHVDRPMQGFVIASPQATSDHHGDPNNTNSRPERGELDGEEADSEQVRWMPTARSSDTSIIAQDFAPLITAPPRRSIRQNSNESRRPFGLFQNHRNPQSEMQSPSVGVHGPILERQESSLALQDAGGLLVHNTTNGPSSQDSAARAER